MKELKRTITTEETYGFESFDGNYFRTKEECLKYEESAFAVAKKTALTYKVKIVNADFLYKWFCGEDNIVVYDIPDKEALFFINTYIQLSESCNEPIPTTYIGKRVALFESCYDGYICLMGDAEDLLDEYTKYLTQLFSDPFTPTEKE